MNTVCGNFKTFSAELLDCEMENLKGITMVERNQKIVMLYRWHFLLKVISKGKACQKFFLNSRSNTYCLLISSHVWHCFPIPWYNRIMSLSRSVRFEFRSLLTSSWYRQNLKIKHIWLKIKRILFKMNNNNNKVTFRYHSSNPCHGSFATFWSSIYWEREEKKIKVNFDEYLFQSWKGI